MNKKKDAAFCESKCLLSIEVKELQSEIIDTFFTPHECCDSIDQWEMIFENAMFYVDPVVLNQEYTQAMLWYYELLKKIRRMSALAFAENAPDDEE